MLRHTTIRITLALTLMFAACGKTDSLSHTGNVADEAKKADLTPYKSDIIEAYNPSTNVPPSSSGGGTLQDKLKSLGGLFSQGQTGSGSVQMLPKLLGALCKVQSIQSQAQSSGAHPQQRGVQIFGQLLSKMKARVGSLLQAKMGGTMASMYPQLPQMGAQLKGKLQGVCQDPSKLTHLLSQFGQPSTLNPGQTTDALGDLSSATSSIQNQLYGY